MGIKRIDKDDREGDGEGGVGKGFDPVTFCGDDLTFGAVDTGHGKLLMWRSITDQLLSR